ncbi:MAG: DnaJ domain-containing protein [Clostridia bacterium]
MTDPYKVLGVSPTATDSEIKAAYRQLAKKYHPDQYNGSPLAELADEKMKEINEAYDEVVARRKNKATGGYAGKTNGYSYQNTGSNYADVRNFINANRIADAEQILNGVPQGSRNAEWYFLKGSVLFRRGWLEEAKSHFERACQMDPSNTEYRNAYNQAVNQRSGAYGGYNTGYRTNGNSCGNMDVCTSLICADCCCECMGGDLIACC